MTRPSPFTVPGKTVLSDNLLLAITARDRNPAVNRSDTRDILTTCVSDSLVDRQSSQFVTFRSLVTYNDTMVSVGEAFASVDRLMVVRSGGTFGQVDRARVSEVFEGSRSRSPRVIASG